MVHHRDRFTAKGGLGRLATWYLPGGPVGPASWWAATSNVEVGQTTQGRFHRLGLTPQLANPRLRDNRWLSPACVPLSSVNLTAHLRRDLTSFR